MKALLALFCCCLLWACESDSGTSDDVQALVEATAQEHTEDSPAASPLADTPPQRPVLEQDLAYGEGVRSNLVGFLAMPEDAIEPLPGVIVIHEWWGLNDNIKSMTRQIAAAGYVALAVDLYGGVIAETPDSAQDLMTNVMSNPEQALDNLRQAYEYVDKYAFSPRVGAIGWCLGGGLALQMALMLPDELDAMVMYYGQVTTDTERLSSLNMPILGLFGAEDASIPLSDVQQFRASLRQMGKRADIVIYSDVGHAFANPSGGTYHAETAEEAWAETMDFLAQNL